MGGRTPKFLIMSFVVNPVAYVHNDRKTISDDFWGSVVSEIRLTDAFPAAALDGLDSFSHAEIIFLFDKAADTAIVTGASHPRGNPQWPQVGIFAQRKKDRPNHIGLTTCEIVERRENSLFVRGLDAIDGTPVLDIKPVLKEFLPRTTVQQPAWSAELMKDYWK